MERRKKDLSGDIVHLASASGFGQSHLSVRAQVGTSEEQLCSIMSSPVDVKNAPGNQLRVATENQCVLQRM